MVIDWYPDSSPMFLSLIPIIRAQAKRKSGSGLVRLGNFLKVRADISLIKNKVAFKHEWIYINVLNQTPKVNSCLVPENFQVQMNFSKSKNQFKKSNFDLIWTLRRDISLINNYVIFKHDRYTINVLNKNLRWYRYRMHS